MLACLLINTHRRWPDCERRGRVGQAIIGNYAVPILEDKTVWGTNDETSTAYLDTQDVAKMTMAALR